MVNDPAKIWTVIVLAGAGTFLMRWSFLGALGNRPLAPWAARMLRYTAVAVLPALIAPAIVWPAATGGHFDPARGMAAAATLITGLVTRNTLAAIAAGAATLYLGLWLTPTAL